MTNKPFYEIWAELENAGFFSIRSTTVLPPEPLADNILDKLCRETADENGVFSHVVSFFERNLEISAHEKNGKTEYWVSSSRPFYSKETGYGKSSDAFYGDGETFESAIRMLYKNFISRPNAAKCKPVHIRLKNGVLKVVSE